uniref:Lycopene cyclase domain-containing protein n=1 Tax=candidate division WOR-3 bacterium TaxID=2052148 RepID=A0A7C3J5F2_UNCW3
MSRYLLINFLIIIFPFLGSMLFYKHTIKRLHRFFISFLSVGIPFIIWDILASKRGDWAFNSSYVNGLRIFGLPLEEILFFLTVPYACLFLYEGIKFFIFDTKVKIPSRLFILSIGLAFVLLGFYFIFTPYTSTVFFVTGLTFLMLSLCFSFLLKTVHYYIFIILTFILFFIFNSILTGIPIVSYSKDAILNIRLGTVPLEDFFYNFSMLTLYLGIYELLGEKSPIKGV